MSSNLLPSNVSISGSSSTKAHSVHVDNSHVRRCHIAKLVRSSGRSIPFRPKNNCSSSYPTGGLIKTNFLPTKLARKFGSTPLLAGVSCYAVPVVAGNTVQYTLADLRRDNAPKHVAIILDGSRRWAHDKPLNYGPFFGANMLFVDLCIKWGVGTATTFVYSLKNLERGKEANDLIFGQFETFLQHNIQQFIRKGIRVHAIGERSVLPESLQKKVAQVEEATSECTKLELMLAVCYAGTRDIVQATRSLCEKVNKGVIEPNAITEGLLESELSTNGSRAPQIDLLIRTGGRLRVSDYLMWQLAQAELYFTNISAPEFSELEFIEALRSFQQSERTFGK